MVHLIASNFDTRLSQEHLYHLLISYAICLIVAKLRTSYIAACKDKIHDQIYYSDIQWSE